MSVGCAEIDAIGSIRANVCVAVVDEPLLGDLPQRSPGISVYPIAELSIAGCKACLHDEVGADVGDRAFQADVEPINSCAECRKETRLKNDAERKGLRFFWKKVGIAAGNC